MADDYLSEFASRGPHKARLTLRSYYCVYYPDSLESDSNELRHKKYSPILWANGTLGFPLAYDGILRHLASWGYVVIASWSPMTLVDQIRFNGGVKISQRLNESDPLFENKLQMKNMGASGHSQGGGVALILSKFKNIKATVALQPAPSECSKTKHPLLIITGGWDVLVRPAWVYRVAFKTAKPATYWLQHKTAGHLMPLLTAGDMRAPTTAFFQWHLSKNKNAAKCFGDDDTLQNNEDVWQFKSKNTRPAVVLKEVPKPLKQVETG